MLKVAVIGCGRQSQGNIFPTLRHADVDLGPRVTLTRDWPAARRVFGARASYTDHREMLQTVNVDAVLVIGPHRCTLRSGTEVLESGRHLFIEKPPGWSLEDARRLQRASDEAQRQVMVGFMKRHARAYRIAKAAADDPAFGGVTTFRMDFTHMPAPDLRTHLGDFSSHPLDLVRFFMGNVTAGVLSKRQVGQSWNLVVMFEHEGATTSVLTLSGLGPRAQGVG